MEVVDPQRLITEHSHRVPSMVHQICVQSGDLGGVLSVISATFPLIAHPNAPPLARRTANALLNGIDQYFGNAGLVYKKLFPDATVKNLTEEGLVETRKRVEELFRMFGTLPVQNRRRFRNVGNVLNMIRQTNDVSLSDIPFTVVAVLKPDFYENDRFTELLTGQDEIFRDINDAVDMTGDTRDAMAIELPRTVLNKFAALSAKRILPQVDYYTIRRSGVSLEGLRREGNPAAFIDKAFRYIQAAPIGDYFSQRLIEAVLFTNSQRLVMIDPEDAELTTLSQAVSAFHVYLAEGIFSNMLDPGKIDRRVDQRLAAMFKAIDGRCAVLLGKLLFFRLLSAGHWKHAYGSAEIDDFEGVLSSSIHGNLLEKATATLSRVDEKLFSILKENMSEISDRVKARFPNVATVDQFLDSFTQTVQTFDYAADRYAEIAQYLERIAEADDPDEGPVPTSLLKPTAHHSDHFALGDFTENSVAEKKYALLAIGLEKSKMPGMRYHFALYTLVPWITITGLVTDEGEVVDYPHIEGDPAGIQQLVEEIVPASVQEIEGGWEAALEARAPQIRIQEAHSALDQFLKGEVSE